MKRIFTSLAVAGLLVFVSAVLSVPTPTTKAATPAMIGHEGGCSLRQVAGHWGHSFSGTIVGLGPAAAVGSTTINPDGSFTGSQTRSFNGDVEEETYTGSLSLNPDCTVTDTVNVYLNGALERVDVLNGVVTEDGRSAKAILTTPGTAILVEYSKID